MSRSSKAQKYLYGKGAQPETEMVGYRVRKGERDILHKYAKEECGKTTQRFIDDLVVAACPPLQEKRKSTK